MQVTTAAKEGIDTAEDYIRLLNQMSAGELIAQQSVQEGGLHALQQLRATDFSIETVEAMIETLQTGLFMVEKIRNQKFPETNKGEELMVHPKQAIDVPKIPMKMICHMSRDKKDGGHVQITSNDALGVSVWSDLNGPRFFCTPEAADNSDWMIPVEPEVYWCTPESFFIDNPKLLEKAKMLYPAQDKEQS